MLTLHAGPWVGEFGWELFGWQGFLRYIAKDFDVVKIYAPTGHRFLYGDFFTYYFEFDPKGKEPNMWMNTDWAFELPSHNKADCWIKPQQLTLMPNAPKQKFIQFGEKKADCIYDIVIHARSITKYGSDYINFPTEKWGEIVSAFPGLLITCVGTLDGSDFIEGTVDSRGIPLKDLADIMASSRVLIGPSSGPMHLGSLCNTPLVVWSGYSRSAPRYMKEWNPFGNRVEMIVPFGDPWGKRQTWQPEPKEIISAIKRVL